ncbi:MAG: lipoyl synthase [Elusimicrobiota bacterium]
MTVTKVLTAENKQDRRPPWLTRKIILRQKERTARILAGLNINTVCSNTMCPNISECYGRSQAAFLILGNICTRGCGFCSMAAGIPLPPEKDEPERIAAAAGRLGLSHVVVTSPTRDDLEDGGAYLFSDVVCKIRSSKCADSIELLIPDFCGNTGSLDTIMASEPDIIGHNIETVRRLYNIRKGADYQRSLDLLDYVSNTSRSIKVKSALMLGLGETPEEILETFDDLLHSGCRYLAIGQYLPPGRNFYPVREYIRPEKFEHYRKRALSLGFLYVESGPYVRSSYNADRYMQRRQI